MIALFSTPLAFTVSVASPPVSTATPSVFFLTMNLTIPLGTPPPGANGSISVIRLTDTSFLLLKTPSGVMITSVSARVTNSVADIEVPPKKSSLPL